MKNVNRFLESPWRSDLFGFNMASSGTDAFNKRGAEAKRGASTPNSHWDDPKPGISGHFCLGHHLDVIDPLTVILTADGKSANLRVHRNHWTPAWMDTIYRSEIDPEYYPNAGTLVLREKKSITCSDVFVSHMTLTNEKRETSRVELEITMPMEKITDSVYAVHAATAPAGLGKHYPVDGYAAIASASGNRKWIVEIPPFGTVHFRYAMAFDPDSAETARLTAEAVLKKENPFKENEAAVNRWFAENVPELETENTDLLKVYYYRWNVVRRSIHEPSRWIKNHPIPGLCMYESPFGGWFGTVIGLPIPWQISEARWMKNPSVTESQLNNWCDDCPGYGGYIQFTPWTAWQYYILCQDKAWLASRYDDFVRYTIRSSDRKMPGMTTGSWVTGAEYQPSFYQYTEEKWDWRYDSEGHVSDKLPIQKVCRVDTLTYDILNFRGCANMAAALGKEDDRRSFTKQAEALTAFLREQMWDTEQKFFFDVDCETGKRCDEAPCYDGFAPFMDGILGEGYTETFARLQDETWFKADFMAPSAAKCCPMFWPDNCIAGPTASSVKEPHPYGCCWNGPSWPYADSIISMGLGTAALTHPELRKTWMEFFESYTDLHFPYGDRSTPVICEHYRMDDGVSFSPINDYFHSSWIDQFMRFYAGISPEEGNVQFRPFGKEPFELRGVNIGGKSYTFTLDESGTATVRSEQNFRAKW